VRQEDAQITARGWSGVNVMFRKLLLSALSGIAMVAATAGPAAAQPPLDRKDHQVLQDVARAVRHYVNYTVFDTVDAGVANGAVRLTGKVTMPYKRDDIERRVARLPGVTQVVNEIEVLPVSQFDEELRYRISRAIYGNPSFWQYASMVNPPIHIVVERGHVTLTGVVQSNVDRMLARSIATSFGAFSVTNDLKTDAEVQAAVERVAN
jgi:osmotically-inducible protein OsmY